MLELFELKIGEDNHSGIDNNTIPNTTGILHVYHYLSYEEVDEANLYIALEVYKDKRSRDQWVEMEDIQSYLADEYNEDGSLRVQKGYEKIRNYVAWYCGSGGGAQIDKYRLDLQDMLPRGTRIYELSLDEIKELVDHYPINGS